MLAIRRQKKPNKWQRQCKISTIRWTQRIHVSLSLHLKWATLKAESTPGKTECGSTQSRVSTSRSSTRSPTTGRKIQNRLHYKMLVIRVPYKPIERGGLYSERFWQRPRREIMNYTAISSTLFLVKVCHQRQPFMALWILHWTYRSEDARITWDCCWRPDSGVDIVCWVLLLMMTTIW